MDCAESGTCAGQIQDYNSFNPYLPESTSRTGYNFVFEPLYFYNAFEGKLIPWIATEHHFNDAYTEVEITIRPGVKWSDGQPWTAHDLVFTINMLRAHAPTLSYSTDMENWVGEVADAWENHGVIEETLCYSDLLTAMDLETAQEYSRQYEEELQRRGHPVAAYKIGIHEPRSQAMFGLSGPMFGILHGEGALIAIARADDARLLHPTIVLV